MIDEHGPALIRDFLIYYRINLIEVIQGYTRGEVVGGWTPGLVLSLAHMLPEGSELNAELQGSRDFRDWGVTQYLLTSVINSVTMLAHITIAANGGKPPKYEPYTGPSLENAKPLEPLTPEQAEADARAKAAAQLDAVHAMLSGLMDGASNP